jgi:hypothetical protein
VDDLKKSDLEEEVSLEEVATYPDESSDPTELVQKKIPADIHEKYEIYSYRNAAVILAESHPVEFGEILNALRNFQLTTEMIRTAGGNESSIPKVFSDFLRPLGWYETAIQGDLVIKKIWHQDSKNTSKKMPRQRREKTIVRSKFLDGHKIDYVKGKVAFDLEWNSKDQTFDRDLYAFSAFAQCGIADAAVLLTRSASLNRVFQQLGFALKKDGTVEKKADGKERKIIEKYGASTTWMGKLLYRLNPGRHGACPVLAVGIKPECIIDWRDDERS